MKEKLTNILMGLDTYNNVECEHCVKYLGDIECDDRCFAEKTADDLIAKGVTVPVQCKDCIKSVRHEIFPWSRRCRVEDCRFSHKETHFCSYGVSRDDVEDRRSKLQKLFGYCSCCGKWFKRITIQRRLTEYENDSSNYLTSCKECHEEDDAYWEERWAEYNSMRL